MIFMLSQCFIFQVINALSGTVNPIQQGYQYQYQMLDWNNSLYFTVEQKYIPASYQYSSQQSNSIKYFIIFAISSGRVTDAEVQNVFLQYLKIDASLKTLTLYFEILTQKQKYLQQVGVTNLNYEGFWYSLEIRNDALQKCLNITYYQNSNKNVIFQKIYQNEYFAITDYFSFYLGESKISKQLGYYQFQGVIKFQLIANTTKFSPTAQSACSSTSGYAMKSQFNFTSDFYYEHTIKDLIYKSYGVTTWVKIDENKAISNNYINVLHIQQNPNSKYQNYIGGKLAQVTYFINSTKQLIQIFYQTFTFPSLPQLSNTGDPLEKSVIYELDNQYSLFNWHYFSYSFRNNQIYLNLNFVKQNYQFIKTITSVNQFSDLILVVHLGGTPTNRSNASGQFNLAYFYPCLNSYTPKCHYSCSTCIGPQSNQCLSCTTSSNRQLSFDFKCICKLGYLDLNLSSCYSISTATVQDQLVPLSTSKEYDQQDPQIICSFGYFRYDDKCYQCPKLKKLYFCPECIQYTNTWVYNPICTKDYQQYNQSENNTFTQDIISPLSILSLNIEPYTVYLFNHEELTFCAYCNSLCLSYPYSQSCQQSNYYHLQKQIMVICSYGAVLQDGECKQQCSEECQKCDYINKEFVCLDKDPISTPTQRCQNVASNVCKQCYDNNNYFLNMEQNDCYPCSIPNCKYCFQYFKSDLSYNSVFQHQPFTYDQEDLAVACALCLNGYAFSFVSGKCEIQPNILGDSCSSYYINQQGKSTCLIDKDFSLSNTVQDCRQYLSMCITCTKVLQNTYYCLQCESGYYLHANYGVCMSCIEYNPLYSECEQVQVFEPLFKFELAPFFFSLTKQHPGQQILETLKIKVKSCISTYGMFNDIICQKSDSINCEFYDRGCRTCASTNEGTKRLTIINLKCSDCPYFCEYCKPREIQDIYSINPYTNITAIPPELTYRCIQKSSIHKNVFFDNRLQLARICSPEMPKCELYHIQKFTTLKSFYQTIISLAPSNTLQYYNLRGSSGFSFFINSSATYLIDNSFFSLFDIQNNYISQVVSAKFTKITYYSQTISQALIFGKLRFLNFQEIEFIQTSILFSLTQSSKLIFESLGAINLLFENCIIQDSNTTFSFYNQIFDVSISSRSYQIAVQNPNRINFTNVLISNISLLNTTFLNLTTVNKQINHLDYVYFQNVTFFNCSFSQTNILSLLDVNQYNYISITELSFIDCNFSNSYFIHTFGLQLKGKFIIQDLVMKNCLMRSSALITIPVTITTTISDLHLQSVQFYDSDFIQVSSSALISNIIVKDSNFSNSKIIHKIKSLISSAKEEYLIENLKIFDCYYQEFNIILIPQYSIEDTRVTLRSIEISTLHSLNYYLNLNYPFFQFQVSQIIIENIKLIRQAGSIDFVIKGCEYVSISDVKILSNLIKISSDSSELIQQTLNTIFNIEAWQLKLENILVQNQLSVNVIFFYFNLIKLQDSQDGYLKIKHVQLENIQLIKQQFSEISTIFYITSLIAQNISISDSQFNGIFLNEFVQDTKISSAAIAVIVSEQSNLKLENNQINDVVVLNSSNSIFLIQTQQTILENLISFNVNNFQSYINKYKQKLLIQFELINGQFLINSQGGLFNFLTQKLTILSCHFENSVGLWGGVLSITTKFFGFIDISQTIFSTSSTNFHKNQDGRGGSIFINSENSYLNLSIKNTKFLNSTSGLEGGVIYIKPTQYQCYLKLQNVTFKDVFAIHYSAIFFQIIESNFDQISSIELFNIEIENQLLQFISFLKDYSIDLNDYKIIEQSAMFSLRNVLVYLNGLKVNGFITQPILYITYIKCLFMDQVILYHITSLYSPLLYIENISQHKSALLIKSTLVTSFNELDQAQIKKYSQIKNINLSTRNFSSLLEIVLNTNLTSAQVVSLNMQNNNCKTCQSGLININNKQTIKRVRLINLYFFQNSCGQGSCLSLNSLISETLHFMSQSLFCYNSAQTGGAIYLSNFRLKIRQTFFLSNMASGSGGAIYYQTQNSSQSLQFKLVSFVNNQAQIGGAIYDKNNYSLDFISFQLINNKAQYFANNLATEPTQLQFLINNKPTIKKSIMVENKTTQIISYLNNSKLTKFIYMPSGVSLNNYQKFNMKTSAYTLLNYNYTIQAVNCFNEQIYDLKQTLCQLNIIKIQNNKSKEISLNSEIKELIFDEEQQRYDLKDQVFTLDPYQDDSFYLQIDASCKSFSTKDYNLRFFVKTYHCQIGEYFENDRCLKCDSLQGYYSVEVKSTQCTRMNIQMIKSTTGAMIELQPGYWRPFLRSNKIEQCKKYPNRCLGGWDVSDNTCFIGSFGALCEECDLFNLRGQGSYLNNKESVCQPCGKFSVQLIFMVLESIWIILLIILTVRSNNFSNKQLFKLKCLYRHYQTIVLKQKM